jgi:hypothetical protein
LHASSSSGFAHSTERTQKKTAGVGWRGFGAADLARGADADSDETGSGQIRGRAYRHPDSYRFFGLGLPFLPVRLRAFRSL